MSDKTCLRCHHTPPYWTYSDETPLCGFCRAKETLEAWVPNVR
jgi:hypothetical protein